MTLQCNVQIVIFLRSDNLAEFLLSVSVSIHRLLEFALIKRTSRATWLIRSDTANRWSIMIICHREDVHTCTDVVTFTTCLRTNGSRKKCSNCTCIRTYLRTWRMLWKQLHKPKLILEFHEIFWVSTLLFRLNVDSDPSSLIRHEDLTFNNCSTEVVKTHLLKGKSYRIPFWFSSIQLCLALHSTWHA